MLRPPIPPGSGPERTSSSTSPRPWARGLTSCFPGRGHQRQPGGGTIDGETSTTRVDLAARIATLSMDGTMGENGWYVSTVFVTMSASDQWSGASRSPTIPNGGEWTGYFISSSSPGSGHARPGFLRHGPRREPRGRAVRAHRCGHREPRSVSVEVNATSVNGWYRSAVSVSLMGMTQ